ncbi:MAG TPA: InlB B-repeat-containing protein, partial [Acidimicrobiales bacterium]|nr:InlB B-repeat-containing protein [Acidimicrobiales bacterium]
MAKVSFTPNGGAGTMANETENYNVATGLSPNDFTLTGYTFTGWNTAANGTGVAYVNGASYAFTASATLYAQWTINAYIVTFSANFPHPSGGAGTMASETENYNVAT